MQSFKRAQTDPGWSPFRLDCGPPPDNHVRFRASLVSAEGTATLVVSSHNMQPALIAAAVIATVFGATERAIELREIRVIDRPNFGKYIADQTGQPIYVFNSDQRGEKSRAPQSNCYGSCARTWTPLNGTPRLRSGIDGRISTFTRADGQTQLAYDGWPLYYFSVDEGGGAYPSGNGRIGHGGTWSLLRPDGSRAVSENQP
jgi:predicted lipoprotein with Yx(FWY)xxD motif